MEYFVDKHSVVRKIWGKSDVILFIFAGASAEFALNKAVDWLYYTGRLPSDPFKRFFSTVAYARMIVFSEMDAALKAIDRLKDIHSALEAGRGAKIPDWAYRDVLFMLIYYSISAFEVLERELTLREKEEVFTVFYRVGSRMGLKGLPQSYPEWLHMRDVHMEHDLEKSSYTTDLYRQYKKHLGWFRYVLFRESQMLVVPQRVKDLLGMRKVSFITPVLNVYKLCRKLKIDNLVRSLILPDAYKAQIEALEVTN